MLGVRHEEYRTGPNDLPFFLYPAIERGALTAPREQNWHQDPEFQLCTEGSGTVLLDGVQYPFTVGDLVIANPNVIHCTLPEGRMTYTCLVVDSDYCRHVGIDCDALTFQPHIRDEAVTARFQALLDIYHRQDTPCRTARLHQALLQLLIALTDTYATPAMPPADTERAFDVIKTTIAYIRQHFAEKLTLDRLARAVYTDKYALCRDFKRLTGRTVMQYVTDYRCRNAAALLAEGYTVTETAHLCGFDNLSFFTKTFKAYTGRLPSACKPSARKEASL